MAKRLFGPTALGIDIDDDHIKLALLSQGLTNKVTLFGLLAQPLDTGVIHHGMVLNHSAFKQVIQNGLKRFKLDLHDVVASLSIPQEKVYVTTFPGLQMTNMPSESLVEDVFPFQAKDAQVRSLVLGTTEKPWTFMAAVDKETIANLVGVCDEIHLQVGALEFDSLALVRLLHFDNHNSTFLLILDIGARHATVVAFSLESGVFAEYKLKSFSGEKLTQVIAQALNLPLNQAETLKRMYGMNFPVAQKAQVEEAVRKLGIELMSELNTVLGFLSTHRGSQIPINIPIMLVGGGGQMLGLADFLKTILNRPVQTWKPAKKFHLIPKMPQEAYTSFAVSIGSALRVLQYE